MAGYSSASLAKKLGIDSGSRVLTKYAPSEYASWLEPLPEGVTLSSRLKGSVSLVHLFVTEKAKLRGELVEAKKRIAPAGAVWVSWPKKAAKVATDMTEDVVREHALPLGLVDVKVCAVTEVWSGLKLVIRKELR